MHVDRNPGVVGIVGKNSRRLASRAGKRGVTLGLNTGTGERRQQDGIQQRDNRHSRSARHW
jgi:hypothetical protein